MDCSGRQYIRTIEKKAIVLEDEDLLLRPLLENDVTNEYVDGLNDPEVNRYLVDVRRTLQTHETVKCFVRSNYEDASSILFGVYVKVEALPLIGTVRISEISFYHFIASIGICLFDKRFWKKGYAVQSLKLVMRFAFEVLGLHYLEAGVYGKNTKSIRLFERAGFSKSYNVKNKYRHLDQFEEVIFFSAINPSFNSFILKEK